MRVTGGVTMESYCMGCSVAGVENYSCIVSVSCFENASESLDVAPEPPSWIVRGGDDVGESRLGRGLPEF